MQILGQPHLLRSSTRPSLKKYFAGKNPLQKQINLGGKDTGMIKPYTIVGVLADQVDSNVGGAVRPFIMLSQHQIPTTSLFYQALLKTVVSFVVRTHGEIPVAAEMRSVFHQAAPGLAVEDFQTMEEAVREEHLQPEAGVVSGGLVRRARDCDGGCRIVRSVVAAGELSPARDRRSHGARRNAA